MRRVICCLSVIFVLVACAVPAFAIGEDYGVYRYTSLPFDFLTISGYGGPIDYFGKVSRVGTELDTYIDGFPNDREIWNHTSCVSNFLTTDYSFGFVPAADAQSTTSITFTAQDELITLTDNGINIKIGSTYYGDSETLPNWFQVNTIRIHGKVTLIEEFNNSNTVGYRDIPFSYSFTEPYYNWSAIDIIDYIKVALRHSGVPLSDMNPEAYFFKELNCQFYVQKMSTFDDLVVSVESNTYGLYTSPHNTAVWFIVWVNKLDLSDDVIHEYNDFDIGTFLGNSVAGFMATPIWGEFTFGHLLGIALTLGVLFFALKLLV